MGLEWQENSGSHRAHHAAGRAAELDATIRDWPRRAENDPYKVGLEQLASTLRPLLTTDLFFIAYNEFCRPSIPDAIDQAIQQGAQRILAVPSMFTPGGIHSEIDIPRALAEARTRHPGVTLDYVWPFDLRQVAALLAAHITQAMSTKQTAPSRKHNAHSIKEMRRTTAA